MCARGLLKDLSEAHQFCQSTVEDPIFKMLEYLITYKQIYLLNVYRLLYKSIRLFTMLIKFCFNFLIKIH